MSSIGCITDLSKIMPTNVEPTTIMPYRPSQEAVNPHSWPNKQTTFDVADLLKRIDNLQAEIEHLKIAAYKPWLRRLCEEYYTVQDLDGDNLIFGHDFIFAGLDFDRYPSLIKPILKQVTVDIENGNWQGHIVPILDYYKILTDERDKNAVKRIFGLKD